MSLKKLQEEQAQESDYYVRPERQRYLAQQAQLEQTVKQGALAMGGFLAMGTLGMVYLLKEGIIPMVQ